MSFKKNTAVTGFTLGMVSATDGSAITTGTPVGYYTLDGGTQTAIGDVTPVHEGNGQWSFDLLAAEMNGDIVGLTFTHTSAIPVYFTIKTDTSIVSDIATDLATVDTNVDAILVDTGTTIPATIADVPTVAEFNARTLAAADYFDPATDAVANVTLVATTTTNTDMRGTDSAALASALATVDTNVDAILVDTGTTIPATLTDMSGATFSSATDSLEALRNRGDSAWTTGAGGTPPQLLQNTTIATLASQTSFTLTAGSADNDAYNGAVVVVTDSATATQKAVGSVSDYVGSTKTVTLSADPAIFTMAVGDTIDIIANVSGTAPTAAAIADAVWDEAIADHQAVLSAGRTLTLGGVVIAETTATGTPTTTEIVLAAGSAVDDFYNDATLRILSGAGLGQARIVTDYVGATKTCSFDEAFAVAPSASDAVAVSIDHVHPVSEIQAGLATAAALATAQTDLDTITGADGVNLLTATQASIDAIEADAGELQANQGTWATATGFATEAKQDIIDTNVDAVLVDTGTTLPAVLTTIEGKVDVVDANVDAVLVDTGTTIDGNITAIKAKTDSLTFTTAGEVDANIQSVNDVVVTGTGASGDEWGP